MEAPKDVALDDMECPSLDAQAALALAVRLYGLSGGTAKALDGYDDRNFWLQNQEVADNPSLTEVAAAGYTLKVTNSLDSRNLAFLEEQTLLILHLADHGMNCPRPVRNKDGKIYSIEQLREGGPGHAVRLFEFIPGETLGKVPWQPDFADQAGRELARIHNVVDGVDFPAVKSRTTEWSLWEAPRVLKYASYVVDESRRALVQEVLEAFQRDTGPQAEFLREDSGLIHGDFNQFNIVVARAAEGAPSPYSVTGVLDLGDCHCAPRLFDVALTAAYMAITSGDVQDIAGVLVGYSRERPLTHVALDLLRVCICARLCQSLVMGLRAHALEPQNTYVLDTQKNGWPVLQALWKEPKGKYEQEWKQKVQIA